MWCNERHVLQVADTEDNRQRLFAWRAPQEMRPHVQVCWDNLTAAEREMLVSGTCAEGWAALMQPDLEEF
jgi:hypothetical protein